MFTLLLIGVLTLTVDIKQAKSEWTGTVYIRADGSIDPPDAPITTYDNVTYTLTDNITSSGDGIIVERDNIVVDGAGYTIQGTYDYPYKGVDLTGRSNVTIKNMEINTFYYCILLNSSSSNSIVGNNITNNFDGIFLGDSSNNTISGNNITNNYYGISLGRSSNNTISGNNITNNYYGIFLGDSSNNTISGNNITNNHNGIYFRYALNNAIVGNNITNNYYGIYLYYYSNNNAISGNNITANIFDGIYFRGASNNNAISGNNITNNYDGITLYSSSSNTIVGNNITANNNYGIRLISSSSNNVFCHNNFINNTDQVYTSDSVNVWDDGYPSGGNYWSDYADVDLYSGPFQNETGSDGIGDMPYVIDENNADRYPLMKPYPWGSHDVGITSLTTSKTVVGQGYNLSINVILFNYGNNTENFSVTLYANTTVIGTFENITLASRNSTTVTLTLNTTGWDKGNYTLWAYAEPVPNETDTTDNTFTYGVITITILGDVDGDFDVDIYDVVKITGIYGCNKNDPEFNPNSDLDDDGEITIYDVVRCTSHYGETYP